ncbi:MAG: phage major capsid protein, partial [Desulfobacterales bacterium]|nr:phage major capsid protein [Desulfobacterales bacterium]
PQYAAKLLDQALEDEIVRPRATVWPMTSSSLKVPGKKITSHATSISGVVAYWIGEKAAKTESDPAFRLIELVAKKLACYTKSSDELVADSKIPIANVIGPAFIDAIQFQLDYDFFQGSGAACPLGIINSPCLISVTKEASQPAATILWENIVNMWASLFPPSMKRAIWVASVSTIPQLLTPSQAIGTGGTHYWPALREAKTGGMTLLTRPILWTEKLPVLGQLGDIVLCDFSQYTIGMRQQVRIESSNAPHFSEDIKDWRAVLRADGQPSWDQALTLKDGSTQVSPFVALAKRE